MSASPHISSGFVASRFKRAAYVAVATERRAGVVEHCVERCGGAKAAQDVQLGRRDGSLVKYAG